MGQLKAGEKAPDFSLPSQDGNEVRLSELLGEKNVVLYFYPKDRSQGCTRQACAFRDAYEVFKDLGAEVVGISGDDVDSHQEFSSQFELPFVLLSDKGGKVRKLFGVGTTLGVLPGRVTFIIDREGIIRHVFSSQARPTKHIEVALEILKEIVNETDES
jgi:peroxiredoxin Q/BCP